MKLTVTLTKIKELPDARHPHNIEEGYVVTRNVDDSYFMIPTVGRSFVMNDWHTSIVQEILSPSTFRTMNSLYEWSVKLHSQSERILCAANHYDDGKEHTFSPKNIKSGFVICGRRHHNCIETFALMVGFPYSEDANKLHQTEIQGFLTSLDRFVDRKEALKIATEMKQLIHNVNLDSNVGLTSEDLY